ncbi:MAG: hypothetical protein FJ368_04415 [Pelagibacterales bacterium]|nr:hypothetical protein [Pelagibacterales bacterium]
MPKFIIDKKNDICSLICAFIFPPIIFAILFQIWNIDLRQILFEKNEDVLSITFAIKTIIHSGWYFSNDMVGFPHLKEPFYLHDFPVHSDFLNFTIVKFFSYFSSDPFLILNLFSS